MSYYAIDFGDKQILVSRVNGNQIVLVKNLKQVDVHETFKKVNFDKKLDMSYKLMPYMFKIIYICIHTSSLCNLSCTYCFLKDKSKSAPMNIHRAIKFIDYIIAHYPHAEKYIVDLTGSGEPLLNMDMITQIGEYCKTKSNEIRKEILPMLVTNGTLLSKDNVHGLRNAGILFGVSIDGTKKMHNSTRKKSNNQGTYKSVIKNVKGVKDRTLIGAAVTLTEANQNVRKVLKHLIQFFPTISIKPVRGVNEARGIHESNIGNVKSEYSNLSDFILRKTLKRNFSYLAALLNGDDYFGKFILRVILNQKVVSRCDAGVGRFSLAGNGKIYACPAAINIEPLEIGDSTKGIDLIKQKKITSILSNQERCMNCRARFVCGGECMVTSYYANGKISSIDPIMCEFKLHLFDLAVQLKFSIATQNRDIYDIVYRGCKDKSDRFKEDRDLSETLKKNQEYLFTELKAIKDNDITLYEKIKKEEIK